MLRFLLALMQWAISRLESVTSEPFSLQGEPAWQEAAHAYSQHLERILAEAT